MLIAKLRISMKDATISYNSSEELETEKGRGTVLPDGKVIRGLGTHFANLAAQERYDRLTKESNVVREKFNRRFMRTPIDGTFIISEKGEAKKYIESLNINTELDVSVIEFELGATAGGLDNAEMQEWGKRVKNQLLRIPLGRANTVDSEGMDVLKTLSNCPVLSKETSEAIRLLLAQVEVGQLNRVDFKRSIELLDVNMDQATLQPGRNII